MATTDREKDDLDAILDDALESFDQSNVTRQPSVTVEEVEEAPSIGAALSSDIDEERAVPPVTDEATSRALEDALRALGELGVGGGGADENADGDFSEADMRLVEEFVTSLGESLSGLGVPGGTGAAPPANGAASSAEREGNAKAAPSEPVVEKLVESIVGHLLSEDVLKAPMQEMRTAYAEWLPANVDSLSVDDKRRFSQQKELVDEICSLYDRGAGCSQVMDLLSKMQETGAPPEEVMRRLSNEGGMETFLERLAGLSTDSGGASETH